MKILFSPSETKIIGGIKGNNDKSTYIFPKLYDKHQSILKLYQSYLENNSDETLSKFFGLKKQKDIDLYKSVDIFNDVRLKAIERYTGVAYDYLLYKNMDKNEQTFIDNNMIIFSNLFGPIFANYSIPNYKLKQGEKLDTFAIEKFYKEHFSNSLDNLLESEFTIDLRAGFYLKFYTPKIYHITMKFLKNGKVVSHWAKAYRGTIAKELACYQPENEQEFQKIRFNNLEIREIIRRKNSSEYIFDINN
jgi:cytoplasmic iron level regulating protein YaaA (DUF328/UPF0246 family)